MTPQTKTAITESFLHLLREKPIDKITVRDIVEDCGITRNTFYYHYSDIYAIVDELADSGMLSPERPRAGEWQEDFVRLMQRAAENRRTLRHLLGSASIDRLRRRMLQTVCERCDALTDAYLAGSASEPQRREQLSRLCADAVIGYLWRWITQGMPPADEADIRAFTGELDRILREAAQNAASSPNRA